MKKLFYLTLAVLAWTSCGTSNTKDNDPWGQVDPGESKQSAVVELSLDSKVMKQKMTYSVWLPNDYDKSKKYPVLYLLHGYEYGDQSRLDRCWLDKGNAAKIADDYQKANGVAMIIVMPNGLDKFYVSDGYEQYFEEELMPTVEGEYNCDKDKRAIAGLSMGGFGTLYHAISYHDKFTYAYAMSPATNMDWRPYGIDFYINMKEVFDRQTDKTHFPDFTIELGKQDYTVSNSDAKSLASHLSKNNINCDLIERDGTHDWPFWQACLPKALIKVGNSFKK